MSKDDDFTHEPYEPSEEVERLHGFYHHGSDEFDPKDESYQQSVAGFAGATIAAGLICLLFVWVLNLCSCLACFRERCMRCCIFSGQKGRSCLVGVLVLAAVIVSCSYFGYSQLDDTLVGVGDKLEELADVFQTVQDRGETLFNQRYPYKDTITAAGCPKVLDNETMEPFAADMDDMVLLVDGLGDVIDDKAAILTEMVPRYLMLGMGAMVAMYWITVLVGIVAARTTCSCDDRIFLVVGSVALIVFVTLLAFELTIAVSVADFCYAGPDTVILDKGNELGLSDRNLNVLQFYISCGGRNLVGEELFNATEPVEALNQTLGTADLSTCRAAPVEDVMDLLDVSYSNLDELFETVHCPTVNEIYTSAFYDQICGDFILGIGTLWTVQIIGSLFLWLAMVGFPCATSKYEEDAQIAPRTVELDEAELTAPRKKVEKDLP